MIKVIIFDWGDTLMRDFPDKEGPMYLWDHVEWIPGAEQALKSLINNYTLVIATNAGQSDTNDMIKALKRIGADTYFSRFFSSKDLGYAKPDVRFFYSITGQLNVNAENFAMIGNDYQKDIIGAKQCGMFTVLFNEKQIQGTFDKADKTITSLSELPEIFKVKS